MKNSSLVLGLVIIIAIALFACTNSPTQRIEMAEENVAQAEAKLSEAKDDYLIEVENFKKETEVRIAANEASIIEFKSLMINSNLEVKKKYESEIVELENRNSALKNRLFEYKDEGRDKWNLFKRDFSHDMDTLVIAFKKAGNAYGLHYR